MRSITLYLKDEVRNVNNSEDMYINSEEFEVENGDQAAIPPRLARLTANVFEFHMRNQDLGYLSDLLHECQLREREGREADLSDFAPAPLD